MSKTCSAKSHAQSVSMSCCHVRLLPHSANITQRKTSLAASEPSKAWPHALSIYLFYYFRRFCLSIQGFLQGVCFCGPVQPGGRCKWCRGCQRTGADACFALGAGGAGRCKSRLPIAAAPAQGCAIKKGASHCCTSALLPSPPTGSPQIAGRRLSHSQAAGSSQRGFYLPLRSQIVPLSLETG